MTTKERTTTLQFVTKTILREMRLGGWNRRDGKYGTGGSPTPYDVNNGWCEEWAILAQKACKEGDVVWLDDELNDDTIRHCVLKMDAVYFDSQCSTGTKHPRRLVQDG